MKIHIIIATLLLAFTCQAQPLVLSQKECRQMALTHSEDIKYPPTIFYKQNSIVRLPETHFYRSSVVLQWACLCCRTWILRA